MINFKSKNWFEQYIEYRKKNVLKPGNLSQRSFPIFNAALQQKEKFQSLRHPLYNMLQKSGLIYGFPVRYPFEPLPKKQSKKIQTKFILMDMILYSVLDKEDEANPKTSYAEKVDLASNLVRNYYCSIHRYLELDEKNTIEQILVNRVDFKKSLFDFRKSGTNSHLFWDWYFFHEYLDAVLSPGDLPEDFFAQLVPRKKAMMALTIKLLSAAVHTDHKLNRSEKVLLSHFKRSARLLSETEKLRIHRLLKGGIDLEDIKIPSLDWVARRYLLDICVLAVFSDKKINPEEEAFLQQLVKKLDLSKADLIESKIELGFFLSEFGRQLHFYNKKRNAISLVLQAVGDNMSNFRKATKMEYEETVDMANTFGLLLQKQLHLGKDPRIPSEEEIAYAFEQLKDIPKFLPFFTMIFVPVPGITELYILTAYSIEKLSGRSIRLLPSNFSRMIKGK